MGRRSSADLSPFYRSVIGWFLPWALIAGVMAVALVLALDAVGGPGEPPPKAGDGVTESPSSTLPSLDKEPPTPPADSTPSTEPTQPGDPSDKKPPPSNLGAGISVQILNGPESESVAERLEKRLQGLGYVIVATSPTVGNHPRTTVHWSTTADKEDAQALADAFGWHAEPRPDNLSTTVNVHVVIGADGL